MDFWVNTLCERMILITQLQPYAVDHLARESMKSAANCVK